MQTKLIRSLTLRYIIALFLVFCVLLFTFLVFIKQIQTAKSDAYIINISGMQRMLSQRIGLMAREISDSQSDEDASIFVEKLQLSVEKMETNHQQLTSGFLLNGTQYKLSDSLLDIYFSNKGLDQRVREFLMLSKTLITLFQQNGISAVNEENAAIPIVIIARNGLLSELNSVVKHYEIEAQKRIDDFGQLKRIAFVVGIIILLLEVIFIFRPMVKQIVMTTQTLEHRNEELIEFSYRISHDLQAPIKSIAGLLTVTQAAQKAKNYDRANTSLHFMRDNIMQLEKLCLDIINLTKMKMAKVDLEEVDIKLLIESSIKEVSHLDGFAKLNIEIECDISHTILVQKLHLQQILANLVSNAIKYADYEKEKPFIKINVRLAKHNVVVTIIDNGLGIPDAYQKQMFKMFQRFHPKASFGSGLGLYLVAQNAKELGGRIQFTPLENGSQFELVFPLTEPMTS